MKKFEITEEQIKELAKGNKKVEKMFPEVFETKLEVGKWYRNVDYNGGEMIAYVSEIYETEFWSFKGYGFCIDGSWSKISEFGAKKWKLATEEEVKSALIKETEKRGFRKGSKFKSASSGDVFKAGNSEDLILFYNLQTLSYPMGCVFTDGVWAQVIKTKYLTKKQAEEELTKIQNDGYEYQIID